jgi:hypothetical protein
LAPDWFLQAENNVRRRSFENDSQLQFVVHNEEFTLLTIAPVADLQAGRPGAVSPSRFGLWQTIGATLRSRLRGD